MSLSLAHPAMQAAAEFAKNPAGKLPCLSIRQPWASLIVLGLKDIENRDWQTTRRGRVLVHAAKGMTRSEWEDAVRFAHFRCNVSREALNGFEFESLQRGGIVGSVEIVDCVRTSDSPWFVGKHGFVLRLPQQVPFIPYKGALGFFGVPESVVASGCAD